MGMKEELNKELELCITIPLKGIKGGVSIVYRSVTVHLRFDYNKFSSEIVSPFQFHVLGCVFQSSH